MNSAVSFSSLSAASETLWFTRAEASSTLRLKSFIQILTGGLAAQVRRANVCIIQLLRPQGQRGGDTRWYGRGKKRRPALWRCSSLWVGESLDLCLSDFIAEFAEKTARRAQR